MTRRRGWSVTARYTENLDVLRRSRPGRRGAAPGSVAFETVHETEGSADLEVSAARRRPEIGEVVKSQVVRGET